jgi:iron(III) transport system substrate-binding protein
LAGLGPIQTFGRRDPAGRIPKSNRKKKVLRFNLVANHSHLHLELKPPFLTRTSLFITLSQRFAVLQHFYLGFNRTASRDAPRNIAAAVTRWFSTLTAQTSVGAFRTAGFAALAFALCAGAQAQTQSINLYTTREPGLMQPLLEAFTTQTGIKVATVFLKDGMLERVKAEGVNSPADVLMVVDIGNLLDLSEANLFQVINSTELSTTIPAPLRSSDSTWFAFSLRDRVLYADKGLKLESFQYEDLANPAYKGKVCIRSGQHPYNNALIASMIAHQGLAETEKWLRGVKANLARKAAGGDRDVARDILGGICDLGLANAYYAGQMKTAAVGSEARKWGDAIKVIRPTFAQTGGTFVNISAAGVAKHAPNKVGAIAFLEYLISEPAQNLYARVNFEYPVRQGVALDPTVASFGLLKPDLTPLTEIAKHRKAASLLVDRLGFDR